MKTKCTCNPKLWSQEVVTRGGSRQPAQPLKTADFAEKRQEINPENIDCGWPASTMKGRLVVPKVAIGRACARKRRF
jgi:hypothetical protein